MTWLTEVVGLQVCTDVPIIHAGDEPKALHVLGKHY